MSTLKFLFCAGEGIVIGVLDTGYSPAHPSFADDGYSSSGSSSGSSNRRPKALNATCQEGADFPADTCK
jgi:subtilisin family serine protease